MSQPASSEVTSALLAHRSAFKAFLVARVGSDADAEDLLQNGLIKALRHADELKDGEKSVAWFYQILRNTIIDHGRSRTAARQRDDAWAADAVTLADDAEAERVLCSCFENLLPSLKPAHADLLRRVDLEGHSVSATALALGLTANHASVTLHRARAELRKKLQEFCGSCADGACLDCDCA
ncbi:MAG: sigma-70 family RNA polymerase sigma factor [Opitutaceae bacterium]|nr:sigma-70 family RNA polymerase sigma factor [Opitutaceae bacterium]